MRNADIQSQYNTEIRGANYKNDYEFNRWFIRARNRAEYAMTYQAIKAHLAGITFTRCLEAGPGPGTWTRLLYRANPEATFHLVDITEAMYRQFRLEMRPLPAVHYRVQDIMRYETDVRYDLFFSSRAVEYFDDKPAFFAKLSGLMRPGGAGILLTKNPYHGVRKDKRVAHQGQISVPDMKQLLEQNGFTDCTFFPAVVRLPLISRFSSEPAEYLHRRRLYRPLAIHKSHRMIESYLVRFNAPV